MAANSETNSEAGQIINWASALEQVADDEDFLKEVLADLITESNTAEEDLADAIKNKNLDGVMKAAHRIKGSASYLCCDQLRNTSFVLQNMGHSGVGLTDPAAIDALLVEVQEKFEVFKANLTDLRATITQKLAE